MSSTAKSKRLPPDAYDHLWSLLPVFLAFFAVIVFAATADDRPMETGYTTTFEALPAVMSEERLPGATEGSVPLAAEALARQPAVIDEPVPSF